MFSVWIPIRRLSIDFTTVIVIKQSPGNSNGHRIAGIVQGIPAILGPFEFPGLRFMTITVGCLPAGYTASLPGPKLGSRQMADKDN